MVLDSDENEESLSKDFYDWSKKRFMSWVNSVQRQFLPNGLLIPVAAGNHFKAFNGQSNENRSYGRCEPKDKSMKIKIEKKIKNKENKIQIRRK